MGQKLSESTIDVVGKEQSGSWNQLWRFVRESDGSYVIHNAENDWCLDVEAGNNIDNLDAQPSGTNIQLYASYNGTSNQRFYIYDIFDSYYFRPVGTEKVIDLGINNNLCAIWDYAENFNPQKFDIIKKDLNCNYPVSIGSDFYAYISNQESKQVFSLGNQLSSEVFDVIGSNNNDLESQIWHFVRLDDGSYSIRCLKNNFCLDVDAGNNMHNISNQPNATNIEAYYHYNGTDNQRFYIYRLFDSYYIRPVGANKLVDMGIRACLINRNRLYHFNKITIEAI